MGTLNDLAAALQDALGPAWRVERELPVGGLGRLFQAVGGSGQAVIVQVLPPDIASRLDTERFIREVDRAAGLRHANLQPVLGAGARGELVWCIVPRPPGESLRFRLHRDGGLAGSEVVQALHDIAAATSFGHQHGIGHGDIKPDNIHLVGERAILSEYGLRHALTAALEGESHPNEAADVHALAVAGQQMLGGAASPATQVVARALSIDPGERFSRAEELRDALGPPPSARRLRARRRVVAASLLLGLLAMILVHQVRSSQPLDPDMVAVAPFEVLDPAHALWREGLVTVLSANLDGAGPLRTVSPTVVIRTFEGSADAQSAIALGERTGAGLVLFGRVVRVSGDSVRISATLVDAQHQHTLAEVRLEDHESRLDQMGDALTVGVLDQLARLRPIGAVRRASLGSSSLDAVKAYLLGEQFYRRSEWDSAIVHYQRAIELDSTFALALYRAGIVMGWRSSASDELSTSYLTRAAAHVRGLPPRESLLVIAESLAAAIEESEDSPEYWRFYRRLYATVDAATRRYPRDPEAWYERGEMRYHYPEFGSLAETRTAFDQAILLDSAFAPAYIHPVELALQLGDRAGAMRYLDAYLRHQPRDTYASAMRLTRDLLDPRRARSAEVQAVLDTASADLLVAILPSFRGWPDTALTGIRLVRLLRQGRPAAVALYGDTTAFVLPELISQLLYHGRLAEAWSLLGQRPGTLYAALAFAGGVPESLARAAFAQGLGSGPAPFSVAVNGAPWWAKQRDAVSLDSLARLAAVRIPTATSGRQRLYFQYVHDGARAFGALAVGDSAAALVALLALPDTACATCTLWRFATAELAAAIAPDSVAARLLARDPPGFVFPLDPFWMMYRARAATRRGDDATARASWAWVRDAWRSAEAPLDMYLREAEAALGGRQRRR